MDYSSVVEFLKEHLEQFETQNVIERLQELDLSNLVHDPYLLGGIAALSIVALFMRWHVLLTTLLAVAGFTGLVAYTLEHRGGPESLNIDSLVTFVVIGAAIVGAAIYLLFIKTE